MNMVEIWSIWWLAKESGLDFNSEKCDIKTKQLKFFDAIFKRLNIL